MKKSAHILFVLFLLIAQQTSASDNSAVITSQMIHQKVEQFVHRLYASRGVSVSVEPLEQQKSWKTGMVADSFRVEYPRSNLPTGYSVFLLKAFRNGQVVRTASYPVVVRVFGNVLVAKAALSSGEEIGPNQVVVRQLDISRVQGTPITEVEQLRGKIARRTIRPGEVITTSLLEDKPVVHRGERTTLLFEHQNVQVKLQAIALQDGAIGETIWFKFPDNRKRYRGKVLGEALAQLQP